MANTIGNLPSSSIIGSSIAGPVYTSIDTNYMGTISIIDTGTTYYKDNSSPHFYNKKRLDVKNGGKIPVDIWAQMYNNGVIDD